jgi:hypothetical protein
MSTNRVPSAILAVAVSLLPSVAGAQVVAADSFVDAAGVNIHLHYFDTTYGNFPLVQSRLIELGVRHVRDGLIDTMWAEYYQRFQSLAQAGIKATFITAPEQNEELWKSYPTRMGAAFEAFEGPNELDRFNDPSWVQTLTDAVVRLGTVRDDSRSAGFPVLGPSLQNQNSYSQLGDLSAYYDVGNIHNYLGGRHPSTSGWGADGYGSIAWSLNALQPYGGNKPVIATENGYHNAGTPDAIPLDVAGRYMPRLLLEQFRAGIKRTFLYELIDCCSETYGLLTQDGSPKPAFHAVKSLLRLLADPGPAFAPHDLAYAVNGGSDVRHMLFQKRNGTYFLALWLGVPGYDNETHQHIAVSPQNVTVTLPPSIWVVRRHRWQPSGLLSTSSSLAITTSVPVTISDALTVIELTALIRNY